MPEKETQSLSDLCQTYLYSEAPRDQRRKAYDYLIRKVGHPDKGSKFERELGLFKYLFRTPVINRMVATIGTWYLQRNRYGALLLELDDEIRGHTGFQVHKDDSLHIFSVEVNPDYQGNGLAQHMVEVLVGKAREQKLRSMRIGGGKNEATNRIHHNCAKRSYELGIIARDGNWIDLI